MQIAHIVDPLHLKSGAAHSTVLYVTPQDPLGAYAELAQPKVFDTLGCSRITEVAKMAAKAKATEIILTPIEPALDTPRMGVDQLLTWFDSWVTAKAFQPFKLMLCPRTDLSLGLDGYWDLLYKLSIKGISTQPNVVAIVLDGYELAKMAGLNAIDVYSIRPSAVNRVINQLSTKHLAVDILELGDRGGRELAEYRFVRPVRRCYTRAAELLTRAGVQLGIPSRGGRCMSSTDFMLSELGTLCPVDQLDTGLLTANMVVLSEMAGR